MTARDDSEGPERKRDAMQALAGEFVLGLLEPAERAAAERRAAADAEFRRAVAAWRGHFAAFDETAPVMMPSPALWNRIEVATATRPQAPAEDRAPRGSTSALWRRLWDSLALWRPAALAGAPPSVRLS